MKTLLFSGASGFLGRNVRPILEQLYRVDTVGITPEDTYNIDFSHVMPLFDEKYDVVLHAAGKAHSVPRNKEERQAFFDVNYQGTVNLCRGLEASGLPEAFIFISTVAVYGVETGSDITEDYPLNGITPYAKSKIMAENYLRQWADYHGITLGIVRPSLIAGPNPPGNLGAMIRGIASGRYLSIARADAPKSVLMVDDIARLIPLLAQTGGTYNVCDDHHPTFGELEILISRQMGKKVPRSIPLWMAKLLAVCGDLVGSGFPIDTPKLHKIIQPLTFSNQVAKEQLNWEPLSVLDHFKPR